MKNIVLCAAIGTVVGIVVAASSTREWSLIAVGAGVGAGLGLVFDLIGIIGADFVGPVIAGSSIGTVVGIVAASTTREWSLIAVGAGVGGGVGVIIALFFAGVSKKEG